MLRHRGARRVLTGFTALVAATATGLVSPGIANADGSTIDEQFNSSTLDPAWTVYPGERLLRPYYGAANTYSLTGGALRYSLSPMTHMEAFLNGNAAMYGVYNDYDPGLDLQRSFTGDHWVMESKANYYMPPANGRYLGLRVFFGDGDQGTISAEFLRYRDGPWTTWLQDTVEVLLSQRGETLAGGNFASQLAEPAEHVHPEADESYSYRLQRTGGVLTASWSYDGTTWTQAWSHDFGTALDGLNQRIVLVGHSWYNPAGSYADYDYITVTPTDTTAPVITPTVIGTVGDNGWYTSDVAVSWVVTDDESAITSSTGCDPTSITTDTSGTTLTCTSTSAGGTATRSVTVQRDGTDPVVSWSGALPADGGAYDFGDLPAVGPTCTATDDTSGVTATGCTVSGYSTAVGTHTLTAAARDLAGNTTTATRTYTVRAWTLRGFYSPVDVGEVWNTVKGGSTVPLKFEVFQGATELTDTSAITGFTQQKVVCRTGEAIGAATAVTSTGGTSLRYDTGDGQFIQNWKTPKTPGACYQVTMTTADSSALTALFTLK